MMLLSLMIIYLSLLFIHLTSPLSMGLTVILLTVPIALMMTIIINTSWFSLLLTMIFLTAMMIIFVYISSLAANELSFSSNELLLIPALFMLMMFYSHFMENTPLNSFAQTLSPNQFEMTYKMYTYDLFVMTSFLMVYLLVALIVVVKNSSMKKTPFRAK
uniref:NADH dehydrogenase subunit 6 n=1 Tax=Trinorchestia longiramus TaxID=1923959 RepID=A0A385UMB5_9CRUS|nr:NADH dehydrogenase subunit 6 [Trinorchestia longiramus]AYB71599.1 NADH dehydrogenase subunit 6 [Trinorchestia longiramus]